MIGVSVVGGVFHNIGQILMAILVTESWQLLYYLPILLVFGVITGVVIGVISQEMLKRLVGIHF